MNYDRRKAEDWLTAASVYLPNLQSILGKTKSEVLIIGAGVFDIYYEQGWIPSFKRKTGDLDLSVGLSTGEDDYTTLRDELLKNGYTVDNPEIEFRLFSPKKLPGGLTYIDLLAHPMSDTISDDRTQKIIGVGPSFSFRGFTFARTSAFKIHDKLYFPNPISMVGLKLAAYHDNPEKRVKDLADIAELTWGIVEKGTHFEMEELWYQIHNHPDAKVIRRALKEMGSGESVVWDLDSARQDLLNRSFSSSEIDETIPARLLAWAENLQIP